MDLKVQSTHSEKACSFAVLDSKEKNSGKIIESVSIIPNLSITPFKMPVQ
jgi:hypothetical protein